jgi:hypothetical protein
VTALGLQALPKQLHQGSALVALAGRVDGVQPVTESRIRLRVEVAVTIQGEAHRGMPGPGSHLLRVGGGRDPQGDGRVAQIVDAQSGAPGRTGHQDSSGSI